MARHTQLEMADIDLREVDGVFSDGEYTRARPLSPKHAFDPPFPGRNDATRRLTSFTRAVPCRRSGPR